MSGRGGSPGGGSPDPLTAFERATGSLLGLIDPGPLPRPPSGTTARGALEQVLAGALERAPCVISFSGGRDSSAVLAVAASVARREGLPLPVPVSLRFPDCETADEREWQELVVRHLELPDWHRPEFHDELDIVGPIAAPVLRDKGVLWPFNAFFHVPIMELARGGTVLSGAGGDEIFSAGWTWQRENLVVTGRRRPWPLDPVRIAVALGPRFLRRAFLGVRRRSGTRFVPGWLNADAFETIRAAQLDVASHEGLSYRRSIARVLWRMRSRTVGRLALEGLAADRDVNYLAPLASGEFLGALAAERGLSMFASRTEAMTWLVGDLLPSELLARHSKAWFDTAFFNRHARAFAANWDGSGVDRDLVDPEALRRTWLEDEEPDARTYQLLQQAWLAADTAHDVR